MAAITPQEQFAQQLTAAGLTPDKPLHAILWAVHDAAQTAHKASQVVEQQSIVREVGQAVRQSLNVLRPDLETRWRWQRWSKVVLAVTAGCALNALIATGVWETAATMAQRDATTEAARWRSWCNAPGHQVVIAGGIVCQVPLSK